MGQPGLFFIISNIDLFSNTNFSQNINVKNESASNQYWDSNTQPPKHEYPPITTRPSYSLYFYLPLSVSTSVIIKIYYYLFLPYVYQFF